MTKKIFPALVFTGAIVLVAVVPGLAPSLVRPVFRHPTIQSSPSGSGGPTTTAAASVIASRSVVPSPAVKTHSGGSQAGPVGVQLADGFAARYSIRAGKLAIAPDGRSYPVRTYDAFMTPNDPSAMQTWVTQSGLPQAWDTPRPATPTTLAIIDTGFALQHEELKDRWAANPGEQGPATSEAPSQLNCTDRGLVIDESCNLIDDDGDGIVDNEVGATSLQNPSRKNCTDRGLPLTKDCNNIDDDNNGLVDDWRGWDFVHQDNSPQAGEADPTTTGGHHATYVSGVAAATGNNGKGIAGVDWATSILPIQALDDDGTGDTVAVANAIRYAASRGADVISLSLGSTASDPLVRQAVQAAIASGSVVVAAAGNDGCNCMSYPANYPEVVGVGAATSTGSLASFSSYGANLDIVAPGVNLYTTDWQPTNQTSAYAGGISGTSLATPIVSGLLTRLKSQQPTATPLQLIAALTETASKSNIAAGENRSDQYGFGNLQAGTATSRIQTPYSPLQLVAFSGVSFGTTINQPSSVEKTGVESAYACSMSGTTPMYILSKNGTTFYTASNVEMQDALDAGYTAQFLGYGCLSMPQDVPTQIRALNLNAEFRNIPIQK